MALPQSCVHGGNHYKLVDASGQFFGVNLQKAKPAEKMHLIISKRTQELTCMKDHEEKEKALASHFLDNSEEIAELQKNL